MTAAEELFKRLFIARTYLGDQSRVGFGAQRGSWRLVMVMVMVMVRHTISRNRLGQHQVSERHGYREPTEWSLQV